MVFRNGRLAEPNYILTKFEIYFLEPDILELSIWDHPAKDRLRQTKKDTFRLIGHHYRSLDKF